MRFRHLLLAVLSTALLALAAASAATAAPSFAPADDATVRPGSMTFTDGAQCTSNFVFFDAANNLYIGHAAHCAGTGSSTETNGCDSGSLPTGTEVEIEGADHPGTLVYSSWLAMQAADETDQNACDFNDFGLIAIDPRDFDKVNPTVPFFGGPTGLIGTTSFGDTVYSYGNSSLRLGASALSPKEGTSLGQSGGGWNHQVYTESPGIPGDSGSGFIDAQGRAFGTLSTVQLAPLAASNGVSDLSRELAYMESHGGPDVELALGTEAFTGGLLLR